MLNKKKTFDENENKSGLHFLAKVPVKGIQGRDASRYDFMQAQHSTEWHLLTNFTNLTL